MSMIDEILGRADENCSVVPVPATRQQRPIPGRKDPPKDEEEEKLRRQAVRRRSVVASIIGMVESDDEGIIPGDAERVDTLTGSEQIPGIHSDPLPKAEGPAEPDGEGSDDDELIQPTAALVAPDITPNVMQPIDPSRVPAPVSRPQPPPSVAAAQQMGAAEASADATGVLATILGRQNREPQPEAYEQEAVAESMVAAMTHPAIVKQRVAEALTPESAGAAMPIHQEGDGKTVYNTFRRFMR
jgi:hypothetical protein